MKNNLYFIKFLLSSAICMMILVSSSCKKKESPAPTGMGTLMVHLHTNVDTNEVEDYDSVYVLTGGRQISVHKAQLYISGIQLVKTDGSLIDVPGVNILKVQEVEPYTVGLVPAGNYQSVKFNVGLSPATNSMSPTSGDTTLYQPEMWFGAAAQPGGYVFVNFQGMIDTTANANGTLAMMQPFSYKIGTNAHLVNVSLPKKNFVVLPNQTQFVHLIIDYNQLFNGIQLGSSSNLNVNTTADNGGTLAAQIANNIPLMFTYEEEN